MTLVGVPADPHGTFRRIVETWADTKPELYSLYAGAISTSAYTDIEIIVTREYYELSLADQTAWQSTMVNQWEQIVGKTATVRFMNSAGEEIPEL